LIKKHFSKKDSKSFRTRSNSQNTAFLQAQLKASADKLTHIKLTHYQTAFSYCMATITPKCSHQCKSLSSSTVKFRSTLLNNNLRSGFS